MMQPADEPAARNLRQDIAQAVVGFSGRGRVVEGQQDAGERLREEQEYRDAAEYLVPAARRRNLFIEELAHRRLHARAMFQPLPERSPAPLHDFFSGVCNGPNHSFFPSTLVSYRSSGRGAGPDTTCPSIENSDV